MTLRYCLAHNNDGDSNPRRRPQPIPWHYCSPLTINQRFHMWHLTGGAGGSSTSQASWWGALFAFHRVGVGLVSGSQVELDRNLTTLVTSLYVASLYCGLLSSELSIFGGHYTLGCARAPGRLPGVESSPSLPPFSRGCAPPPGTAEPLPWPVTSETTPQVRHELS